MKVVIAGCGWLGRALALAWVRDGHTVVGIRRDPDACRALEAEGIEPLCLDLCSPDAAERLPADADAVVACQAAGGRDADSYRRAYIDATAPLLRLARLGRVRRLVWSGSTGVFGQGDGAEVTETTPPLPAGPTAEVLVEAERRVLEAATVDGLPACVLRLSGLYGPGRYGVIRRVREGRLALGPDAEAWMNWCHREDAVRAVRAAIDHGRPGAVYHASDAHPTRRRDVVRWICDRLGIDPAEASAAPAPARDRPSRRISAEATRHELGLTLAYPSFREGLQEEMDGTGDRRGQ